LRFAVAGLLLAACSSGTTHARATPPPTTTSVARGPLPIRQSKIDVDGTNVFVVSPSNGGRYPLIVFSHGYQSTAEAYTAFFQQLARTGYVVAGPDYPQSAFATHPPIVTKVIDRLMREPSVDPDAIAVAGHSLGGLDALGAGYDTCCRDPRVRAVMVFESPRIDFPGGSYRNQGPPILVVQGDQDPLLPTPTAADITHPLTTASYEVLIPGGMHGGGLDPGDPGHAAVALVVSRFLSAFLHNDATARHWLATTTQLDGSAVLALHPSL
jgi:predicted dienelactone hydrolase